MGYIIRRIPYAGGVFADNEGKSNLDYTAFFDEKYNLSLKQTYIDPMSAVADGCKFFMQEREGKIIYSIIQGVDPECVRKVWEYPTNVESSKKIIVNYYHMQNNDKEGLKWFVNNLPLIKSREGIDISIKKLDQEIIDQMNKNQPKTLENTQK